MENPLLYSYLTNPLKTMHLYKKRFPIKECWLVVWLVTLSIVALINPSSILRTLSCSLLMGLALSVILFLQAVILDFIAQCFKFESQSLRLFNWLGLSLIPLLLVIPASVLLPSLTLKALFIFIILSGSALLQVLTLIHIYTSPLYTSVIIYMIPFLTITVIMMAIMPLLGIALLF
jgi:hypothetical protein